MPRPPANEVEGDATFDNGTEPLGVEGPATDVQKAAAEVAQMLSASSMPRSPSLSLQDFKSLLRSIGLKFNIEQREVLNRKVSDVLQFRKQKNQELGNHNAVGATSETPHIDFADFLCLMRWMLDCNFAGINEVASRIADLQAQQRANDARLSAESMTKKRLRLCSSAARTALSMQEVRKSASKDSESQVINKSTTTPGWPLRVPRGGLLQRSDAPDVSST